MDAIIPAILTAAGAYFFFRNLTLLRNKEKLRHYVETNPKARLWRNKFGPEKTFAWSEKYFLPFGLLVSGAMFVVGLWALVQIVPTVI